MKHLENWDLIAKKVQREMEKMPLDMQRAVCWAVEHLDMVKGMVNAEEISESQLKKYIEEATEKKDYILLVMALYKQAEKERKAEYKE